jgi:phosphopantetheinyl transferase (holo-ACP synthase)
MVGNDIVDLELAQKESNWKRNGYLDKIATVSEQILLQNSDNQDVSVWNLWSRKEAVYKIILQKGGKRGYYPIKIECLDLNSELGIVRYQNQCFYTRTIVTKDYIYSEAVENYDDLKKIKELAKSSTIIKLDGIPFAKIESRILNISKTHHGRFEKVIYVG